MSAGPDDLNLNYSEPLAIHGGPKAKRTAFAPRQRHGELEKRYLAEVIDSDVLFYFIGTKVFEFQRRFAGMYGRKHCVACSSGTAAVHIALGALELPPGSEVITPAITDMGSLTGLLYQGLVPVFADVDPATLNMDPAAARRCLTDRTRAILVVHHSGLAADMDAFLELGREFKLPVVEDCAQAYGTTYKGRRAGTMGRTSAFSLNHFKHITCGSGGMVLTDDDRLRYLASLFLDKCFQREEKTRNPFFLAPNYQMTELQGAVALAAFSSSYPVLLALFAYATFAYAACSTMFLALPADAFHTRAVGSVSGMGGTAAGIGTLITTFLIGKITDRFSFEPVVIAASIIPCLATILFVTMVRAAKREDSDKVLLKF